MGLTRTVWRAVRDNVAPHWGAQNRVFKDKAGQSVSIKIRLYHRSSSAPCMAKGSKSVKPPGRCCWMVAHVGTGNTATTTSGSTCVLAQFFVPHAASGMSSEWPRGSGNRHAISRLFSMSLGLEHLGAISVPRDPPRSPSQGHRCQRCWTLRKRSPPSFPSL